MPTTYEKADVNTELFVQEVMGKYHKHLADIGLTLNVLFAYGARNKDGEQTKPAIVVGGYPALACIKVNKLEDRVAGLADATMIFDGDSWNDHERERQVAIIDHELEHIELKQDRKGVVKTDDVGRPLFGLKKHDIYVTGFRSVAERHREVSVEVESIAHVGTQAVRQGWLPGF